MLYICIHNDTEIEFPEEYPTDTQEEIDWANRNAERLEMECILRRPEIWEAYSGTEKQFAFEVAKK